MILLGLFVVLLSEFNGNAIAFTKICQPRITSSENIRITKNRVMLVTHASDIYDTFRVSSLGINKSIQWAKKKSFQVLYLQDGNKTRQNSYFYDDCEPDFFVNTETGELDIKYNAQYLVSAGGFWEACLSATIESIFRGWAAEAQINRNLVFVTDAIYTYNSAFLGMGGRLLRAQIVTLKTALNTLKTVQERNSLIRSHLQKFHAISQLRAYRVVYSINGSKEEVLYDSNIRNAPVLKIKFLSSDMLPK